MDAAGEEGLRDDLKSMFLNDTNRKRLEAVRTVAARHNCSISAAALAYLLCQPLQTVPIIGASSPEQLSGSVEAVTVKLTPAKPDELRACF